MCMTNYVHTAVTVENAFLSTKVFVFTRSLKTIVLRFGCKTPFLVRLDVLNDFCRVVDFFYVLVCFYRLSVSAHLPLLFFEKVNRSGTTFSFTQSKRAQRSERSRPSYSVRTIPGHLPRSKIEVTISDLTVQDANAWKVIESPDREPITLHFCISLRVTSRWFDENGGTVGGSWSRIVSTTPTVVVVPWTGSRQKS